MHIMVADKCVYDCKVSKKGNDMQIFVTYLLGLPD